MKAYVIITGIVFALIVLGHVARVYAEGARLLREPSFLLTSLIAVGLTGWAVWLARRFAQPRRGD